MVETAFIEVWDWVLQIGDRVLAIYRSDFSVTDKGGNDPVTEADLWTSEFLYEKISKEFPDHGFLSEEKKDNEDRLEKEWVWILDPIDGTREFVKKNDQFALSLGLVRSGIPIWGIVFNPATGELFSKNGHTFQTKLKAPYHNQQNLEEIRRSAKIPAEISQIAFTSSELPLLYVSGTELREGLFDHADWRNHFQIQAMGSIAYKLGLLSSGQIDLIVSLKPKSEWDICAGVALLSSQDFEVRELKTLKEYHFNGKFTKTYGLLAGKKSAVEYLKSKIDLESLTKQVRDSW
ncbi:inositol monophosphatase family protein [Leptospira ryugenii]|uniref:Inositol monophosphatase family protein n=1 Tax=Leptospira ryugenii TaxID=1917863 RepID=A0A2P2DWM7_9LEPT|nr:3'(2'),5'-bisphosphate nucleotidase CysQ [Leptospira ryugenii]GBF49033.1 inositol monophosphatase family protein [Leptospira ryugenii]